MNVLRIPLAASADKALNSLSKAAGAARLLQLDGAILLGERAAMAGMTIPGRTSAGGGCRLYNAVGDTIALNLARSADRELLPALLEADPLDFDDEAAIAARIATCDAFNLLARGRSMGMAIAVEYEPLSPFSSQAAPFEWVPGEARREQQRSRPRVLDLSALWAGPLAAHLLWLANAEVIKVESRNRPDAMRDGDSGFYALLNQGKASVALDLKDALDRQALIALIKTADIVIEAARPRALAQLGIDVTDLVRTTPGLVWLTITAHGVAGDAANWVGFGDDCGVAGGLSAALRAATGRSGFVGDAIADPLTGISAALAAWRLWNERRGGRFVLSMRDIVARSLAETRARDPVALDRELCTWSASVGQPFPAAARRLVFDVVPAFGADTQRILQRLAPC